MTAGGPVVGGRLVVVGPGRLGTSLAAALEEAAAFRDVEVRGREAARDEEVFAPGDCLLFTVPDDALADAARGWSARLSIGAPPPAGEAARADVDGEIPVLPAPVALHTSGVHPASVLEPLRRVGMAVAAWHPLTAVARSDPGAVRGVAWGLEGDEPARSVAAGLSRRLEGWTLDVDPARHALYHVAAVFASNFVVACLGAAREALGDALTGDAEARLDDLLPLTRAAVAAVASDGLGAGLTGPVARGDVGTVRVHLAALDDERRELYRRLARELLRLAAPDLPPARAAELEEALAIEERPRGREEGRT